VKTCRPESSLDPERLDALGHATQLPRRARHQLVPRPFGPRLLRGWSGWAALALSVAVYGAVSILMHQPFHDKGPALRYFDLRIYRDAAERIVHAVPLYRTPMLRSLGFTYPPFAGLLLAPLAWVPLRVDELVVAALNILLLVWTLRRALLIRSARRSRGEILPARRRADAWSQAALLSAAALWLEPVSVTLGYGQINLLITALIVFDLSRPEHARTKGVAIGVAAAIKLTPLLFIPYLLLSRRRRAAAVAAMTFAASVAISFVVVGHDASDYWFSAILNTSRVGNVADPLNQSLLGAIARLTGTRHPAMGWHLLVVAIALCGLVLAARASRRGDEAAGFSLTAVSTLLASPISWPHHWTLAVPALVLLARRAHDRRSRALGAAVATLMLLGCGYLPELAHDSRPLGLASLLTTDPYVLAGVSVLAISIAALIHSRIGQRSRPTVVRDRTGQVQNRRRARREHLRTPVWSVAEAIPRAQMGSAPHRTPGGPRDSGASHRDPYSLEEFRTGASTQ
jgi:alpha-1,2-mannosyltransferase